MKKILVSAVIALTIVNVSAKGKCETHYVNTTAESSITCNMVCKQKECVETIIIPANFKDRELKLKSRIFVNDKYIFMPGEIRNFSLKIINLSNNIYTYQNNSLYLKPVEDDKKYHNLISYNKFKIPIPMYRLYNSEPLKALYDGYNLSDDELKDENVAAKLKELGYTNGIQDLDKYYIDYFNKNYNTNFVSLEDLTTTYINKIWTNKSKNSKTRETNTNLIKFYQNNFYNFLLTMRYNSKSDLDNNIYSIGAYSRKEKSYQDLNATLLNITLSKTSKTALEPFFFHLNGPLTRNSYTGFTYDIEMGMIFNKVLKYGIVNVYYIDTLGNLLTDKITMRDEIDTVYTTEEKSLDGYKLVRVDGPRQGTFKEKSQEVYYMYDIDNPRNVSNIVY